MIKALVFIVTFGIFSQTYAIACKRNCGVGNCGSLSYFMSDCAQCKSVNSKCSRAFCKNHPNLCDPKGPLKDLGIDSMTISHEGKISNICLAKLFPEMTFKGHSNGDINIAALNTLDIKTFGQTRGATPATSYERNIGIIRKLMANYLVAQDPKLQEDANFLMRIVDQRLTSDFMVDIKNLSLLNFHTIAEDLRAKIFKLKGIETQLRFEVYEGKKYPMTVSKLGCIAEKSTETTPLANNEKVQ